MWEGSRGLDKWIEKNLRYNTRTMTRVKQNTRLIGWPISNRKAAVVTTTTAPHIYICQLKHTSDFWGVARFLTVWILHRIGNNKKPDYSFVRRPRISLVRGTLFAQTIYLYSIHNTYTYKDYVLYAHSTLNKTYLNLYWKNYEKIIIALT